jgi:large subunit ribosomal protein L7/L12
MVEEKKEAVSTEESAEEEEIEEKPQEEVGKKEETQKEEVEKKGEKEEKKVEKVEPEKSAAADKKEDKEKKVEIPKKFKSLVEEIEKMSVLDLAELVKVLEKKFGVSAAAQVVAAPAGQAAGGTAEAEEKSVFKIELKAVGDKKIEVIKVVRDLIGKGLKEAKDLVDAVASGAQVIKENAKKEEAEDIKKKFEAAGATIELK